MYKQLLSLGILSCALCFGFAQQTPVVSQINLGPVVTAINQMRENLSNELNHIDTKLSDIKNKLSTLSKTEDYLLKIKASVSDIEVFVKNRYITDGITAAKAANLYYEELKFDEKMNQNTKKERLYSLINEVKQKISKEEKNENIKKQKINDIERKKNDLESQEKEFLNEINTQKMIIQNIATKDTSNLPIDCRINLIKSAYESISSRGEFIKNKIDQIFSELK